MRGTALNSGGICVNHSDYQMGTLPWMRPRGVLQQGHVGGGKRRNGEGEGALENNGDVEF